MVLQYYRGKKCRFISGWAGGISSHSWRNPDFTWVNLLVSLILYLHFSLNFLNKSFENCVYFCLFSLLETAGLDIVCKEYGCICLFLSVPSLFLYVWNTDSYCPVLQKSNFSLSIEYIPLKFYMYSSIFTVTISSFSEWIQNPAGHLLKFLSVSRRYSTLPIFVMCDISTGKQITIPMMRSTETCSKELCWMTLASTQLFI